MTQPSGGYDLHRTGEEIVNNRHCNFATCGVKRYAVCTHFQAWMLIITCTKYLSLWNFDALTCRSGPSHDHGHSSEIYGPGDGVGGWHLPCCSYNGCYGKDHACRTHSSKRARHSISPEPDPISYR